MNVTDRHTPDTIHSHRDDETGPSAPLVTERKKTTAFIPFAFAGFPFADKWWPDSEDSPGSR